MRDQRVFIKTIEGLQRVDVIIRHVDDTFCDPRELRAGSFLGVPGLVESARAGNVAISNALGAGAVAALALLAFLPALAQHFFKEDLRIPNVATWWCGQAQERAYTLANLHALVVKRGFAARRRAAFRRESRPRGTRELAARIAARPHAFVGRSACALDRPGLERRAPEPRPLILRLLCATADGYTVLPAG